MAFRMDVYLHSVLFALGSVGGAVEDMVPLSASGIDFVEADRTDFGVAL